MRRVLVEPSVYHLLNDGDVAMLQAAVRRLGQRWPDARIEVFTEQPDDLPRRCPGAVPLLSRRRDAYFRFPEPGGRLARGIGPGATRRIRSRRVASFARAVTEADAVIASGAGGTADDFRWESHTVLDVLELAIRGGVPTAMMGQAFGPVHDRFLRRRAREVLTCVDLICLREGLASRTFLESLGVPRERIVITGDDAIERAMGRRRRPREAIGFNLRLAPYSAVDAPMGALVARTVRAAAERSGAGLLAIPISHYPHEMDAAAIASALGADAAGRGGGDVIDTIGHCRIVVTASYHAAVFALAQGIPAVGLVRSPYYRDKFAGLAGLFGDGCTAVTLDEPWERRLDAAIQRAWDTAGDVEASLVASAERQVQRGHDAYDRLARIVEGR